MGGGVYEFEIHASHLKTNFEPTKEGQRRSKYPKKYILIDDATSKAYFQPINEQAMRSLVLIHIVQAIFLGTTSNDPSCPSI